MTTRWKTLVLVIAMGSMGAGPGPAVTAQAPAPESRTTEQLLQEVRALRAAIERMTVSGTRAQLLLGRLQMQEQRMTTLGRQLQETRTKVSNLQRERQNHVAEIELLPERIDRASTPDERLQLEMAIKSMKHMLKQLDQQVDAAQADDVALGQALSAEQARWIELNGRLEELEGMLATQKP